MYKSKPLLISISGLMILAFFMWSSLSMADVFFNKLAVCACILTLVGVVKIKAKN